MGAPLVDSLSHLFEVEFLQAGRLWLAAPLALILILAPLLAARTGDRRRGRIVPLLLRGLLVAALCGVLLQPVLWGETEQTGSLIVVADVSPSVGRIAIDAVADLEPPFHAIGAGATPGELEPDPRPDTDLAAALRLAAARAVGDRLVRVVLVSDGRPTRPGTAQAARQLRGSRVELWARAAAAPTARPARVEVEAVTPPQKLEPGKPFALRAKVSSDAEVETEAVLVIDGEARATIPVRLVAGSNEVRFQGTRLPAGRYHAQVLIGPSASGVALVVPGRPAVLCLGGPSLIAEALETQGMDVTTLTPAKAPDQLDGFDAVVILPDAPAKALEQMTAALSEFVGRRGGGLLAVGGAEGPGLARLHGTPTAHLLPVEVPPRVKPGPEPEAEDPTPQPRIEVVEEEIEAYPITLCIVVDRSGSMHGRKLRQAKAAAAAAASALTLQDRIAVVVFGDQVAVPLAPRRAGNAAAVARALEAVQPEGQTAMFRALEVGYAILRKEQTPIRHMLLVSDGISTDDGPWKSLIRKMTGEKITLSVVGIGFEIDQHKLGSMAGWGKGTYWLANRPDSVPQIVTMDTKKIVAARDRRGEDAKRAKPPRENKAPPKPKPKPLPPPELLPILPDPGAPREMFLGISDEDLPEVAGVETGTLRFASWAVAHAGEAGPPLVAYGRLGLGTTAALLLDPEGRGAKALREHREFPRLVAQLVRSILPEAGGEPLLVKHSLDGDTLAITALGEDGSPRTDLPVALTLDGKPVPVRRRGGRFEAQLPERNRRGRLELRIGDLVERSFAAPPSRSRELAAVGADRNALLRLTGSTDRLDNPAALTRPTKMVPHRRALPLPFLLLAAILLPLDAWARRRALQ